MILRQKIYDFLRWSEKYTGTDMIYLAKGGSWVISGSAIASLLGISVMVIFDRFISKEIFGTYQYILSMAAIIGIFSLPGIDTALIRTVAKGNEKILIACFRKKVKWGLIGSLISVSIAFWYFLQQNFELGILFLIISFFLPFINSLLIFLIFWNGKKRFDIQNKYYIFYSLIATFILILIIILTKNLVFIVFGYFSAFTLAGIIFYRLTVKKISNEKEDKETIPFGKHLTLMNAIHTLSGYIDKVILWKFLGPIAVAIFIFAEKPVQKFQGLFPISSLALPKLSQSNIKKTKKDLFRKFLKLFLFIGLAVLAYILISPFLFKILFPAYPESVLFSQVLSLVVLFVPFTLLSASLLTEMKKKELYLIQTITPLSKIILFIILIPLLQIWGVVISILISQTLNGALTLYFFRKI